jgi:hypothetical protein
MRTFLFVATALSILHAGAVSAQHTITATAHVAGTLEASPARVEMKATTRGVVRVTTGESAQSARGVLERTYVTDASPSSETRAVWVADGRGLRRQVRDADVTALKVLLGRNAIDLATDRDRKIIVTKVVAADS